MLHFPKLLAGICHNPPGGYGCPSLKALTARWSQRGDSWQTPRESGSVGEKSHQYFERCQPGTYVTLFGSDEAVPQEYQSNRITGCWSQWGVTSGRTHHHPYSLSFFIMPPPRPPCPPFVTLCHHSSLSPDRLDATWVQPRVLLTTAAGSVLWLSGACQNKSTHFDHRSLQLKV